MDKVNVSLRLDPQVHEHLARLAEDDHRSMNGQVTALIEAAWNHRVRVRSSSSGSEDGEG